MDFLYPEDYPTLEYTVLTHHDLNHVESLIRLLKNHDFGFNHIYHNGLASYNSSKADWKSKPSICKENKKWMGFVTAQGLIHKSHLIDNLDNLLKEYKD